MKITLSKQQWEFIGNKTGWIKYANSKRIIDKNNTGRTMTLSGPDVLDPNFSYTATIRDASGVIESVFDGTLKEIYLEAKARNFAMPETIQELQAKNSNVIKIANSQNIAETLKNKHPWVYKFISRMPGFNSALDIVDNIQNNQVAPEQAGITSDIINQANQMINKLKATASNKALVKESLTLDARLIAAIILIILGIFIGKSMLKDVGEMKAMPTQAEQFQNSLK